MRFKLTIMSKKIKKMGDKIEAPIIKKSRNEVIDLTNVLSYEERTYLKSVVRLKNLEILVQK